MACCGSKPQGGGGGAGRPKAPVPVRSAKDEAPAPSGAAGTAADLGPNTQQPGPKAGVIHTTEELPPSLQYWPNGENRYIRVSKSTYPANAPNEDRCTFAADTDTGWIFAGVWDGHGTPAPRNSLVTRKLRAAECRALLSQLVAVAQNGWTRTSPRFS
eukprot:COSAG02_NODE_3792_length_6225_cov_5.149037_1_plen_158_part_00